MIKLFFSFLLVQLLQPAQGFGQTLVPDSVLLQRAKQNAVLQYQLLEGVQSRLYNGKLYRDYTIPLTEGHPYFSGDQFENGTVSYDGMVYANVPLLFNIVTDEVITPHYNKVHWISLRNDKISSFSFGGHYFIRVVQDSAGSDITTGIYEQLYAGKSSALKKKWKYVTEAITNNQLKRSVKTVERRYLWHDGSWQRVTSLRSVLKVLNGHNAAIRQHLRSANIKYKRKPDQALARVAAFYDQLTAGK